jgi:hypothetical protein
MSRDPIEVTLSEPIKAHGETVRVLTLKPPKGRHLRVAGYPFRLGGGAGGAMQVDAAVMARLISELAEIPTSSVDQLEAEDWQACLVAVSTFLAPTDLTSSSSDTSNKPDGGETPATSGI